MTAAAKVPKVALEERVVPPKPDITPEIINLEAVARCHRIFPMAAQGINNAFRGFYEYYSGIGHNREVAISLASLATRDWAMKQYQTNHWQLPEDLYDEH